MLQLAAEATPDSAVSVFLDYGIIGAALVVLGFFAWSLIKREQARADKLQEENSRLHELIQDKTVPALVEASRAVTESRETIESLRRQQALELEIQRRKILGDLDGK